MKEIMSSKWKVINLIAVLLLAATISVVQFFVYIGQCNSLCSAELIWGLITPVYNIAKFLILIFIIFFFIPVHIFKHWFCSLLPLFCFIMYLRLSTISVNEYGGILQWSRSGMAEFGTIVFATITVLFVIAHLVYDWKKKK